MCHAPIVVPAVGRGEARHCRRTTRAMREIATRVVDAKPDRLVLLSPHSPRRHGSWGAWAGPRHRGDLGAFRAPEIAVDLPDAPEVNAALGLPTMKRLRRRPRKLAGAHSIHGRGNVHPAWPCLELAGPRR